MANSMTGPVWNLDSLGIITTSGVWIRSIIFYPNAEGDAAQFLWWDENSPAVTTTDVTYTITVSTDNTVTSTGNFPSTYADGKVVKIWKTSGSDAGKYGLIKTAGNNNAFVTHLAPFTTEANKVGSFYCLNTYNAIKLMQPKDTNEHSLQISFPGPKGLWLPNLALDSLSSSATIALYPSTD